jgi:flagellar biogenesis protein FliO
MDTLQPIAAVFLVLALLGATLFFLRKRGAATFAMPRFSPRGERRMEVIERVALSPQHALHLVRIGGAELLIATAPASCALLTGDVAKDRPA